MRLPTRLSLALVGVVLVVMAAYIAVSYQQRRAILAEGVEHQLTTLGTVLRLTAGSMLNGVAGIEDLDRTLRAVLPAADVFGVIALDPAGTVVAGTALDLPCLRRHLPRVPPAEQTTGHAACAAGVRWVSQPLGEGGGALVVALEETLLDRIEADAFGRQLLVVLVLALTISLAIVLILREVLARPLEGIMRRVHALAATGVAPPAPLDEAPSELVQLAAVLDETLAGLEAKRNQLVSEAEERLALERRLRESESFAMIGRLSGGLAHELGSPLSVIGMRAETIRDGADAPDAVRRQADVILAEVGRLSALITGLLHVSRRQGVVFEPVELDEVVRGIGDDLAAHLAEADVELRVDLPDEPVLVRGQSTLLRHAVRNLGRNGVQALRDQPPPRRLELRLTVSAFEARIAVEDNGPGIPEDRLRSVFDPFFTTREVGEGLGLGLSVSKGIVEEHGGQLTLERREDGGTRALITLPRPPEP